MAFKHYSTKICEYITETADGKFVLAGTFTNLNPPAFPAQHLMGILVEFNGDKDEPFRLSIEGPSTDRTLVEGAINHIPVQTNEFEQSAAVTGGMTLVEFPEAGVYRVVLRNGKQLIHEYPFGVFSKKVEDNGS